MHYAEPDSIEDVFALLAEHEDALPMAGGATLVAMMNADLLAPDALISLRRVPELAGITTATGSFRIGAMTRHADIAADTRLTGAAAVVRSAAAQIAHPAVRNAGTIGGAICHADPNADFPGALVAADAVIEIRSADGQRQVPAGEFFLDYLETCLEPGEIVTAINLPAGPAGAVGRYLKYSRVDGDYAIISVASVIEADAGGCRHARIALGSAGPVPVRVPEAEAILVDGDLGDAAIARAGALLAEAADPVSDVRGSADYRRRIIPGLLARALAPARA